MDGTWRVLWPCRGGVSPPHGFTSSFKHDSSSWWCTLPCALYANLPVPACDKSLSDIITIHIKTDLSSNYFSLQQNDLESFYVHCQSEAFLMLRLSIWMQVGTPALKANSEGCIRIKILLQGLTLGLSHAGRRCLRLGRRGTFFDTFWRWASMSVLLNKYCQINYKTAVAQWLRCCATNRKVVGSIPAGVTGIFHWHKIHPIALWLWGRLGL